MATARVTGVWGVCGALLGSPTLLAVLPAMAPGATHAAPADPAPGSTTPAPAAAQPPTSKAAPATAQPPTTKAAPATAQPTTTKAAAPAASPGAKPHFVYRADKGFIDDAFAVDPVNGMAAILRTDSASFARLEVIDLQAGKGVRSYPLGDPQQIFERVLFAGDGTALVLITRNPTSGNRTAQRFDEQGAPGGLVGPATDFGVTSRGGKRMLVAWTKSGDERNGRGKASYTVTAHDLATLTRIGKTFSVATEDGVLKKPALKLGAWADGYTRMVGQKLGEYDKQKDVRLPDRAAAYDVLSSNIAWESDIGDVYAWATVGNLRKRNPNRSAFVVVTADQSAVELVDALGTRTPLPLAQPFEMYDPRSLVEQELGLDDQLTFGLSLDPMNPQALARRKADKPYLDLYAVRLPISGPSAGPAVATAPRHLVRVPLDERPVGWVAAGRWVLVLAKHKTFSRGGNELSAFRAE